MARRSDFIHSLSKAQLLELATGFQLTVTGKDTVEGLRKLISEYVTSNNILLERFPKVIGADISDYVTGTSRPTSPLPTCVELPNFPTLSTGMTGPTVISTHTFKSTPKVKVSGEMSTTPTLAELTSIMSNLLQLQQAQMMSTMNQTNGATTSCGPTRGELLKDCLRQKIQFGGKRDGSVLTFIRDFEGTLRIFHASEGLGMEVIPSLLFDEAKTWWEAVGLGIRTFDDFRKEIKESFLPSDFDYKLEEEIRNRRQGPSEPIDVFANKVVATNRKLSSPLNEAELCKVLCRNVHKDYVGEVVRLKPTGIQQLREVGRQVEEIKQREREYQNPQLTSSIESTLNVYSSSRDTKIGSASLNVRSGEACWNQQSNSSLESSVHADVLTCFNCNTPGHVFKECSRPRIIFCYRCGAKGRTTKACSCNQPSINGDKKPEN